MESQTVMSGFFCLDKNRISKINAGDVSKFMVNQIINYKFIKKSPLQLINKH